MCSSDLSVKMEKHNKVPENRTAVFYYSEKRLESERLRLNFVVKLGLAILQRGEITTNP